MSVGKGKRMNEKPPDDQRRPLLKRVASGLDSFAAGMGVAAILAGVTAYLVRRKQKSPTLQAVVEPQPPTAPTSPPRKPNTSIIRWVCVALWVFALIFGVLALLAVVTRRTDAWWWVALLCGALSMYFATTGVGLWRLRKWGFVLSVVGFTGLAVFSLVLNLQKGDVAESVWDIFIWGVMIYGLTELSKTTKHGPRPAFPSPPRQPGGSAIQRISMLWKFVFVVLALFVMITSVTDVWWVILLSSALIMYFVITGVGVWQLQKWGFALLAVGLTGLVVFSLVSDARDSGVVGFVWRVSILAILLPGLPELWKVVRTRFKRVEE
jgi:lysylphosphatidylglycerol synthetase-like protein (DUF2156 family)